MVRHSLTRLATLAALAAGSLAKPVVSVEKVVRQDVEQSNPLQSSITAPDGAVIVSSSGYFVIGPTETVTHSTITKNEFETHGVTFAFEGDSAGNAVPRPTAAPKDPPIPWHADPAGPPPENEEGESSPPSDGQDNGGDTPDGPPVNGPEDSPNETGDDGNPAEDPAPDNPGEDNQQGSGSSGEPEGGEDAEIGPPSDGSEGQGGDPANPEDGEGTSPGAEDNGGPPPGTEDGEGEGAGPEDEEGQSPNTGGDTGPPPETGDEGAPAENEGEGAPLENEGEGVPPENEGEGTPAENEGEGTAPENEGEGTPPENESEGNPPENEGDGQPPENEGEGTPPENEGEGAPSENESEENPPENEGEGTSPENEGEGTLPESEGDDENKDDEEVGPPPETEDNDEQNDDEEDGPPPETEDNDEEGGPPPDTEDNNGNNDEEEGGPPPDTEDNNENDDDDDDDDDGAGGIIPVPIPNPPTENNPNPLPGDNSNPEDNPGPPPEDNPDPAPEDDTEPEEDQDDEDDEPTASATTSATSTTESEMPTRTDYCSRRTCGGELCPAKRGGSGLAKRAVDRKPEPEECKWAGPENYEDPNNFMASEASLAESVGYEGSQMVPIDEDNMDALFTSEIVDFMEEPVSLAVPRLVGCTSIIVVSTRGAWASHIWEDEVFVPLMDHDMKYITPGERFYSTGQDEFPREKQLAYFRTNVLEMMHTTGDIAGVNHASGLDELRGDEEMFDDASKPHVFMFIPYKRIKEKTDPNYDVEQPNGVPAAWDKDGNPSPRGDDESDSYNDQISNELKKIFGGGVKVERVLYAPHVAGSQDDNKFESARGRALIQYQPAGKKGCADSEAKWRVFFETETKPHKEFKWDPWPDQNCIPSGDSQRLRRQDECPTVPEDPDNEEDDNADDAEDDNPDDEEDDSSDEEDEPEKPAPQPLKENPPKCNNEDDFPGHADLKTTGQMEGARYVCTKKPGRPHTIREADAGGEPWEARWSDMYGNNYDFSIYWEKGCTTKEKTQDMYSPLGDRDNTCTDFFIRAYDDCINGGVGGKIKVGCVVYQYDGGRG